jgi:hypothetical protein
MKTAMSASATTMFTPSARISDGASEAVRISPRVGRIRHTSSRLARILSRLAAGVRPQSRLAHCRADLWAHSSAFSKRVRGITHAALSLAVLIASRSPGTLSEALHRSAECGRKRA